MKNQKGIALILSVGILALLAVIATSFALNMRLEYKAARNYYDSVKANYLAEAAIARAIAELKAHVKASAFDDLTEVWAASGYTDTISSTAASSIVDEQRKVNVNNANQRLLENLFTELGASNLYSDIKSNRPTDGYVNIRELRSLAAIAEADYDAIADYVTVYSYEDPNAGGRSPININTCANEVLRAVLTGLSDGSTAISSGTVTSVAAAILAARPITTWAQFDTAVEGAASAAEAEVIESNCNPNRTAPSSSTTEFCFNSGGVYKITGTGTLDNGSTRLVSAVVKIYDIYNQTTTEQFRGEDADYDGSLDSGEDANGNGLLDVPVYERVTWLDGCPIDASDLFGQEGIPSDDETVPGSLKIGYWDDFDEDPAYSNNEWTGPYTLGDPDGDGDDELYTSSTNWPLFALQDAGKWSWLNYALRIHEEDSYTWPPLVQMKEVGWVQCNGISILLAHSGYLEWGDWYRSDSGACVYSSDGTLPLWLFSAQLLMFPQGNPDASGNFTYSNTSISYSSSKTFNITHTSGSASCSVYTSGGSASLAYPNGGASTLSLYGQNQRPYWDDLRIISSNGSYTSITYEPATEDVDWGTLAYTGTEQTDTTISMEVDTGSGLAAIANGGSIGGASNTIQYKATLTSGGSMQNTPILEDVTITYLLPTEILSWSGS